MFSYLRYFSIISFIVVVIAAFGIGYYFRAAAGEDLRDLMLKNNRVLVQGFISNLWKEHRMVEMIQLFEKNNIERPQWQRYRGYKENFEDFQRSVFKYFEETPIVQVNIYDSRGELILSLNQARIIDNPARDGIRVEDGAVMQEARRKAQAGTVGSKLIEDSDFELASGDRKIGTLMQTAVPIMSKQYVPLVADEAYDKSNNVQGVVEIYYDISRQWAQIHNFQYLGTGAIVVIFLVLIITLIVMATRAEAIIARQHEANLELAAQAAAAEAENQNKSQFLANISHELRTPLNAIIGFSEILRSEAMESIPSSQHRDYIKDIHNSGVHLLSLINDILDYSKAEAGKLDLRMDETDITKLILSSMRLVKPRADEAQVTLTQEIPKEHYVMETDAKKFKQIMLNLLSNAVKFTQPGGEVCVTLWQNLVDQSVSVEVKDTGIGIAPKDISRALAPFGQVDSALSRKYEGTGLGLPLTKKFVEIMGGTFSIQSEEGVGTTITISLPMQQEETPKPTQEATRETSQSKGEGAPSGSGASQQVA